MPENVNPVLTEVKPDETPDSAAPQEPVKPDEAAAADELDGFKSKESKDAVLADLAKVREELKAFQDREAEAEKAKLSDIEKAQSETQAATTERDEARAELATYKIATKHGITDDADLAILADASSDEAKERLAARMAATPTPNVPKPDKSAGPSSEQPPGTIPEQIAAAEKAGDKAAVGRLKALQLGALANSN